LHYDEEAQYPSQYTDWLQVEITRVHFSTRPKVFLLTTTLRPPLGFCSPAPYPRGTGRYSPDIKWVGGEADNSHLLMRLRIHGSESPFPIYAFMVW
jgi:hypothetical protein